jgi:hypothetical protein
LLASLLPFAETILETCPCTILSPDYNALNGPVPTEIGLLTSLTNVDFCKLADHKHVPTAAFSCFIIVSLLKLTWKSHHFVICGSCAILLPDNNALTGSIPSEIGLLTSLASVNLRKFLAAFASLLLKLAWKPHHFVISYSCTILLPGGNRLTESIPTEIGLMTTSLTSLNVGKLIVSRVDCGYCLFRYYVSCWN